MFSQIASFVLEVFFGLLIGACLLRLAMQRLRVPFGNPVGRFVMAVSNWIVLPLRRVLPSVAGWDTSSLVAAWLMALAHQVLLLALMAGLAGGVPVVALMVLAVFEMLRLVLSSLFGLLLVGAILSWVPTRSLAADVIEHLCAPLLRPIRRILPLVGGIDLSPLVAIVLVQVAQMLLAGVQAAVMRMV